MPRHAVTSSISLTPGQASYVLDRLIREGRVSLVEVNRYVSDMQREISDLESHLQRLRAAAGVSAATTTPRPLLPKKPVRPRPSVPTLPTPPPPAPPRLPVFPAPPSASTGLRGRRKSTRRRARITPEVLVSRQLQGRYLGLIRQIPVSKRARYTKIAKEKGRVAAIQELASTLKK